MCGLFGIWDRTSERDGLDIPLAKASSKHIQLRGPDSFDQYVGDSIYLSHSRLSIVDDKVRSNQPMFDRNNKFSIVYNGEIYNHKEIRHELIEEGHQFDTESDTETLLYALIHWGESALEKLNGMFAFAFYNFEEESLLLARDGIGIKPLYYSLNKNRCLFSSTIFPIVTYQQDFMTTDLHTVLGFLSFRTTIGRKTLVPYINKLLPGELLLITKKNSVRKSWYRKSKKSKRLKRENIENAIKNQNDNSKPLASLLSGGIDSSIIASELSRYGEVDAYSAFYDGYSDETPFAKIVCDEFSINHHMLEIEKSPQIEKLKSLIAMKQYPIAMHNEVGMYELAREVSKKHKVMFCGEGADELFSGYGRIYRLGFDQARLKVLSFLPKSFRVKLIKRLQLYDIERDNPLNSFYNRYCYFPDDLKKMLLKDKYFENVDKAKEDAIVFFSGISQSKSTFGKVRDIFLSFHLPSLLEMVDSTSMVSGVEGRVPFTDKLLVDTVISKKSNFKIYWRSPWSAFKSLFLPISQFSEKNDIPKYKLKKLYSERLPKSIIERKKVGFPSPLADWASTDFIKEYIETLDAVNSPLLKWFDAKKIQGWYSKNKGKNCDNFGKQLWLLINLDLFFLELEKLQLQKVEITKDAVNA